MAENEVKNESTNLFSKYKGEILLGVLIIYVALLALGTIGELFDVEWILNLPIFK